MFFPPPSTDPNQPRETRSKAAQDWFLAFALPIGAIGLYWALHVWTLYVGYWRLWVFAFGLLVISLTITATGIRCRRLLVVGVSIGGFIGCFWIGADAVGLVREWTEIRVADRFAVSFPKGQRDEHSGSAASPWGRYRFQFLRHNAAGLRQRREFRLGQIDLEGGQPSNDEECLRWLAAEQRRERAAYSIVATEQTIVGKYPAVRIAFQQKSSGGSANHEYVLCVAANRRGYVLSVWSTPEAVGSNLEVKHFFGSLEILE